MGCTVYKYSRITKYITSLPQCQRFPTPASPFRKLQVHIYIIHPLHPPHPFHPFPSLYKSFYGFNIALLSLLELGIFLFLFLFIFIFFFLLYQRKTDPLQERTMQPTAIHQKSLLAWFSHSHSHSLSSHFHTHTLSLTFTFAQGLEEPTRQTLFNKSENTHHNPSQTPA